MMGEFFSEFKYMCSANNQTSRKIYIFFAVMLILLTIGSIALAVLSVIVFVTQGVVPVRSIIACIVVLGIVFGVSFALYKS